jgi:hypothetical protein
MRFLRYLRRQPAALRMRGLNPRAFQRRLTADTSLGPVAVRCPARNDPLLRVDQDRQHNTEPINAGRQLAQPVAVSAFGSLAPEACSRRWGSAGVKSRHRGYPLPRRWINRSICQLLFMIVATAQRERGAAPTNNGIGDTGQLRTQQVPHAVLRYLRRLPAALRNVSFEGPKSSSCSTMVS